MVLLPCVLILLQKENSASLANAKFLSEDFVCPPPPEQVQQLLHVGHPAKKLVPFYLGERCYHLLPCVP